MIDNVYTVCVREKKKFLLSSCHMPVRLTPSAPFSRGGRQLGSRWPRITWRTGMRGRTQSACHGGWVPPRLGGTGLCSRAFAVVTPTLLKADNSLLGRYKRSIIRFSSSVSPSRKPLPDHRPITTPLVNNGDRQAKANLFLVANWWRGGRLTLNPPCSLRTSVSSPLK